MELRKLGNSGIEIAPLALGGNVFGWTIDEPTSHKLLDGFVAAGFNLIDTADIYSTWAPGNKGGESETIIGNWLTRSKNRHKVIIATKVGMTLSADKKGLKQDYIKRAVDDSLQRLQTDYIDLYQAHIDDPETPLEETLQAFTQLIKQGKIRAIGASNYTAERLSQALQISKQHGYASYQSLQPCYNLYDRADYEEKLEPLCQKMELGVISYYSLASGFLTGKYRSTKDLTKSVRGESARKYLNARGLRILKALDEVAQQYHSTPGRVALAWLIARPSVTAPISSATNMEQLKDLIAATKLELQAEAIATLNQASA